MAAPRNPRGVRRPGRQGKNAAPQTARQRGQQAQDTESKVTLLLSGGAPHASLMAGALAGLYAKGKTFHHIWTTGAGCIVGLVYIAPKHGSPYEALEGMLEMSIADPIYRVFPVNYKVFKKPSPFLHAFERWGDLWKLPVRPNSPHARYRRFWNDSVEFWTSMLTPPDLHPDRPGLCEPLPFLEEIIDFDGVQQWPGGFFLNAYNLTDHTMEVFAKSVIDPLHVRAATAAPFLYPPVRIGAKEFREGAFHDPLALRGLRQKTHDKELDTRCIVLSDILGRKNLLQPPRNLWEAYGQSIMEPVVSLAEAHRRIFEKEQEQEQDDTKFDLIDLNFDVPEDLQPHVLDWSYSNMRRLWEIGIAAGERLYTNHKENLPDLADLAPWPHAGQTP